ncbi:flagellar basal-body rod protein FlgF [Rhodothalassium salexigens DSM 2132]|uniref:Flagellar basal-body rod protein FlgF n=1 Tax=Rhodothalassium salexigens DSM 2132 TaxID=1188247 RepID=A0A4R2PTU5_RHOSA|nr:flagellar basal-body rod protein FlgF [Rhodothalassium salexigens]MBB4210410.1 flagellar basal-body rod protein FlgF [Rhodothalassium salexigens DSM 2132]TCP38574.1 flagellar basal-body rod protein FlgF [Rhodothalassium salexigens DSM 2132]
METMLLVNASQRSALERQMDVIANNLANLSTTAYKGERAVFSEYLVDTGGRDAPRGGDETSFVLDYGTIRSTENGPIQITGNALDIALEGPGFMQVQNQDGELLYTRRGHLTKDEQGFLALPTGERVLDDDGNPIDLNTLVDKPVINPDGTISLPDETIQINLVLFDNDRALERRENSLFAPGTQQPRPTDQIQVVQGALEGSNVNAIKETTRMLEVMRAYQSAQRSTDSLNDVRDKAIDALPRAN